MSCSASLRAASRFSAAYTTKLPMSLGFSEPNVAGSMRPPPASTQAVRHLSIWCVQQFGVLTHDTSFRQRFAPFQMLRANCHSPAECIIIGVIHRPDCEGLQCHLVAPSGGIVSRSSTDTRVRYWISQVHCAPRWRYEVDPLESYRRARGRQSGSVSYHLDAGPHSGNL